MASRTGRGRAQGARAAQLCCMRWTDERTDVNHSVCTHDIAVPLKVFCNLNHDNDLKAYTNSPLLNIGRQFN